MIARFIFDEVIDYHAILTTVVTPASERPYLDLQSTCQLLRALERGVLSPDVSKRRHRRHF